MFVLKEKKSSRAAARAADAIDLMIEFATLGEYGLENPEPDRVGDRQTTPTNPDLGRCDRRPGAGPQKHRERRRPCRPGRTRTDLPGWGDRPGRDVPGIQPSRRHKAAGNEVREDDLGERLRPTSDLPAALRPPRIRLDVA